MSVFDDHVKSPLAITASMFADTILRNQFPNHNVTDEELDNIIKRLIGSIYDLVSMGKYGQVFSDCIRWSFHLRCFGVHSIGPMEIGLADSDVNNILEKQKHIKQYVKKRFEELGFLCDISDFTNSVNIDLPIKSTSIYPLIFRFA